MLFNYLFISLCVSIYAYEEILNSYALNISQAAYCIKSNEWDCNTCHSSIVLLENIENDGVRVINAIDHKHLFIIASFRGSSNIQNWVHNLEVKHIKPYDNYQDVSIDKGFYNSLSAVRENLYDSILNLNSIYENYDILITGHSMGGALASLTAFELIYLQNIKPEKIYLMTFGSPRVGNDAFKKYMNIIPLSWRTTHYYDMIPHLPQEFLDYIHISQEIWYNEENSKYTICNDNDDEDKQCSNSCAPTKCTSIDDHLYYLNISMGNDGLC